MDTTIGNGSVATRKKLILQSLQSIGRKPGTAAYYYLRPPSVPFRLFRRQSLHNHSLQDHPLENPCTLIANQRSLDNKVSSGSSER